MDGAAAGPPPAAFICVCDQPFGAWEELGQHQEATGHMGMRLEGPLPPFEPAPAGAKKGAGRTKVTYGKKASGADALWEDPFVDMDFIYALQAKIDAEQMKIGGLQAGKACLGKRTVEYRGHREEISCPHRPVMRTVQTNECDLEHKHTETLEQVCLIHACLIWGGGKPAWDRGPLLEGL